MSTLRFRTIWILLQDYSIDYLKMKTQLEKMKMMKKEKRKRRKKNKKLKKLRKNNRPSPSR